MSLDAGKSILMILVVAGTTLAIHPPAVRRKLLGTGSVIRKEKKYRK